jgi:hypothetical protein
MQYFIDTLDPRGDQFVDVVGGEKDSVIKERVSFLQRKKDALADALE